MTNTDILLVGKPWRGGLCHYLRIALAARFPGRVLWIPTYPDTPADRRQYRRDRHAWRRALVDRIGTARYRAAVFVNHAQELASLPYRASNILWLTDDARVTAADLAPYARVWISDPGYTSRVQAAAGSAYAGVLPFGFEPGIHRADPARNRTPDRQGLCTVANRDPKRDAHLEVLLANRVPARIVGNYFARHRLFWRYPSRFRPSVPFEAMARIYARYAVSLNVHARVVRAGTNMRTFECAGYEIPQLVEYRPGIEALFEPGEEIAVYERPDSVAEAARSLLTDAPRQARLATRALARARAEHTYSHRVQQIFADLA